MRLQQNRRRHCTRILRSFVKQFMRSKNLYSSQEERIL